MKKIIASVFLLLYFFQVRANHATGRLSVTVVNTTYTLLFIDGRLYDSYDQSFAEAYLAQVAQGMHHIKVLSARGRGNVRNERCMRCVYEGKVMVRPGVHVDVLINRFGKVFKDESYISTYGGYAYYDSPYGNGSYQDRQPIGMSAAAFGQFKHAMRNIAFEETRMSSMRQIINRNYLSIQQVIELMRLFEFEVNRLEIAKACYPRSLDKDNYYLVNDAFSFNSSKEAMNQFLATVE